jgi:hypothetical protein
MDSDFGMSPFRGQLSGKPLPAGYYEAVVPQSKRNGASRTIVSQWTRGDNIGTDQHVR